MQPGPVGAYQIATGPLSPGLPMSPQSLNPRRILGLFAALAWLSALAGCAAEKAEGRPWVHAVRFVGVEHVSKRDLKAKLAVQATSWIPWAPRKYLDPYMVPSDRDRIVAYYRAHGYFAARVTAAEVKPRKSRRSSVDIEFKIHEGAPTKIAKVELSGVDTLRERPHALEQRMTLKSGQILVHDAYAEQKQRLERMLTARGYAWATVDGTVEIDRDALLAQVRFTAVPGLVARFGRVEVEGNTKVRAIDIQRTADLDPGAKFSMDDLEGARGRVYNVGVFGSARVTYAHDPVDPSIANVKISVTEAQFHELRLGGGLGIEPNRNDVHLSLQYTKRNFLGGLRTVRLRLEPAYVVLPAVWAPVDRHGPAATAEVTFVQPFLFGLRHFELRWTVGYDLGIDYAYQYHGPRAQLGVYYGLWRQKIQLGFSYNFQFLDFFRTEAGVFDNPAQAGSVFGYVDPYRVGWWQQDFALDLRDRPLDPHHGFYFLASLEEGGVHSGSAFTYEKIVPDARGYVPLGPRVTLAARVQYGKMFVQGDELGSPITRRLYLGGPSSHRGFSYNRLAYQVQSKNSDGTVSSDPATPIGGDEMILLQAELRVRVVKVFDNWFSVVAFADGGDVTTPSCRQGSVKTDASGASYCDGLDPRMHQSLHFTDLHWAVGGGLRYATVIGTIRVDVAGRLNRKAAIDPDNGGWGAFHISIGEAF